MLKSLLVMVSVCLMQGTLGLRQAKSEIIAFIDDDAVADKDWLRNIFKNYSDPSVVGVGGLVTPLIDRRKIFWVVS